jgi:hypothetical protein
MEIQGPVGKYASTDWIQVSFINVQSWDLDFFIGYHRDDNPIALENKSLVTHRYWIHQYLCIKYNFVGATANSGPGRPSHTDILHSVGFLWMRDRPVAETST